MLKSPNSLGPLLLLAAGSGVAALVYEIVWFQLLELVIGSSAVSLAILLATFMGGTCLGSLIFPRLVSPQHDPLRAYAVIEFGISVCGILILLLMPLVGGIYTAWSGYGLAGFLVRGVVAAACLLPPTLLMGATLPALARCVRRPPQCLAVGLSLCREHRRGGVRLLVVRDSICCGITTSRPRPLSLQRSTQRLPVLHYFSQP